MGEEGRNFRSYYYDKVGFRGVEERKSLEMLLKDKPIDLAKLLKFCLCFSLPSMYREYVWKLLLDILPTNPESQKFVTDVQREQFNDLYHALEVMKRINKNTPLPEVIAHMFLLEEGNFWSDQEQQMLDPSTQHLIAIATTFTKMCSSPTDAYWMTRNFCQFQRKFSNTFPSLHERLTSILEKEDPDLYRHLLSIKGFKSLPTHLWFSQCFAEVLHENALERIWDKVIGSSSVILAFVGAALLITLRRTLLAMDNSEEVVKYMRKFLKTFTGA
ncbi:TBC1 domain family member 7 isoform X2 [Tachypleus tridentatus]|uniref:TBC1 domain family member 7 isoform X2 n=1 Tax=Tachypleus tridentatus TaxID=6853 RepID=UPI003FD1FBFB